MRLSELLSAGGWRSADAGHFGDASSTKSKAAAGWLRRAITARFARVSTSARAREAFRCFPQHRCKSVHGTPVQIPYCRYAAPLVARCTGTSAASALQVQVQVKALESSVTFAPPQAAGQARGARGPCPQRGRRLEPLVSSLGKQRTCHAPLMAPNAFRTRWISAINCQRSRCGARAVAGGCVARGLGYEMTQQRVPKMAGVAKACDQRQKCCVGGPGGGGADWRTRRGRVRGRAAAGTRQASEAPFFCVLEGVLPAQHERHGRSEGTQAAVCSAPSRALGLGRNRGGCQNTTPHRTEGRLSSPSRQSIPPLRPRRFLGLPALEPPTWVKATPPRASCTESETSWLPQAGAPGDRDYVVARPAASEHHSSLRFPPERAERGFSAGAQMDTPRVHPPSTAPGLALSGLAQRQEMATGGDLFDFATRHPRRHIPHGVVGPKVGAAAGAAPRQGPLCCCQCACRRRLEPRAPELRLGPTG